MVYDAVDSELVLFGGNLANSTWTFHNGSWFRVPTTVAPPGGASPTMAYDLAARAVVLLPGDGSTWEFSNNSWARQSPPNSPSGRSSTAFFYDRTIGGMILWGGEIGAGVTAETWEFRGGNWTQLSVTPSPPAGYALASAYDSLFGFGLVVGPSGTASDNSSWTWSNRTWSNSTGQLGTALPAAAGHPSVAYDSTDEYIVEYGETAAGFTSNQTWLLRDPLTLDVTPSAGVRDIGQATQYAITVSGGIGPYTTAVLMAPPGCSLSPTGPGQSTESCLLNSTGNFTLLVNASDTFGTSVELALSLQVNPDPNVSISANPNPATVGIPVHLDALLGGGTTPESGNWSTTDGISNGSGNLLHTFSQPGAFTANFSGADAVGFPFSASLVVIVNPFPQISVTASSNTTDAGIPIDLNASAVGGTAPLSYGWEFGDGDSSNLSSGAHVFIRAGVFDPRVWANDSLGASASTSIQIQVNPALAVNGSSNTSDPIQGVQVSFESVVAGGTGPDTFWWTFGDGGSSRLSSPTHTYQLVGPVVATLRVNDSVGGARTIHFELTVFAPTVGNGSIPPSLQGGAGYSATIVVGVGVVAGVFGLAVGTIVWRRRPPTDSSEMGPRNDPAQKSRAPTDPRG